MDVSFEGINNLYIGRKCYSKSGHYMTPRGNTKFGPTDYTEVLIKCDLTDDNNGKHLTAFNEMLSKCRPCYQVNCIDHNNPSQIKLLMKRFQVPDGTGVENSTFDINDYEIMLDEKKALPLFSFMAKLTRYISCSKEFSQNRRNVAKDVNIAIQNKVVDFIENIMPNLKE
ncbi:hypothetical protein J6E39_06165 [bacterium]|nr:hypothetical protein [bacterium]